MSKPLFDAEALIGMFESATAKQGEQVRKAVSEATLKGLQARELSLKNIRSTLKSVTDAAGAGALKSPLPAPDVSALLDKAVAGMDDALLRAVDANRTALATLMAQGADMRDKHLKKAIDEVEKLEDTLMGVLRKSAEGAARQMDTSMGGAAGKMGGLAEMWAPVLDKLAVGGTLSGASAATTVEQLMTQMQSTMRSTRSASLRAAAALAESYAAMASGVLIGMSEALQQGQGAAAADEDGPAAKPAARRRR